MNLNKSTLFLMFLMLPALGYGQIQFIPPVNNGIDFGQVEVGDRGVFIQSIMAVPINDVQQQVNIRNANRVFRAEPAAFAIDAGAIVGVTITFEPQQAGNYRDEFQVVAMNPNGMGAIYMFNVSGQGVAGGDPEIQVEPDLVELSVIERGERDSGQFEISNIGDADLEYEVIDPNVDWLDVPDLAGVIAPGQHRDVEISTTDDLPDNGDYHTEIIIESNDPENREVSVEVTLTVDIFEHIEQRIPLEAGWSMISLNIDPSEEYDEGDGPDVRLVLEGIMDHVVLFKDGNGNFCVPGMDFWGITTWDGTQGYLIKMDEESDLAVNGYPIPLEREIELEAGWNMIPYFPSYEDRFDYVLSSLVDRDLLILAKNGYGAFYTPEWGVGGDCIAHPGEGLLVKVTRNCTFRYPEER